VVATQDQRRHAFLQRFENSFPGVRAGFGDFGQVMSILLAAGAGFRHFHPDIAGVGNVMAERPEPCLQSGNAQRRRPHIHAPAARAHVERNAEDADAPAGKWLPRRGRSIGSRILSAVGHQPAPP
jgi:hypothetical protein